MIHVAFFKPNKLSFCISVFSLSTSLLICFVKIFLKFWVNLFHRDWRFKGPKFQTKPFFFLLYNLQCFIMRLTFPLVENLGLDLILRGAAKFFSTFAKIFLHFCFKLSSWPELGWRSPTPISFQKESGRNPKTRQNPLIPGRNPKKISYIFFLSSWPELGSRSPITPISIVDSLDIKWFIPPTQPGGSKDDPSSTFPPHHPLKHNFGAKLVFFPQNDDTHFSHFYDSQIFCYDFCQILTPRIRNSSYCCCCCS